MNKIIFQCQYFTIKVREVVLFVILLSLLFFWLHSCQSNNTEIKREEIKREEIKREEIRKEDKIEYISDFTSDNINDFNRLMSRADLCSEEWFNDLTTYIARLEDQNKILEKKDTEEYKTILKLHKEILIDLKVFKENQQEETVKELEASFKEYKKYYDSNCKKGN